MKHRGRGVVQILFLGFFLAAIISGKAQLWMGFIFLSILFTGFFGRFYCGWVCPINTVMRPFIGLSKKLGLQKKQVPQIFKVGIRRGLFSLFLVGLGYTVYTITQGRKFPLPLIIIPLGVLTAFFINEKAWHRYLCPWGVLFSLTGRFSKRGIKSSGCLSCSACERICPGEAITIVSGKEATINPAYCLLCLDCTKSCPVKAISYKQ